MEKPMNNAELAALLAEKHGLTKTSARALVDDAFAAIIAAAARGEDVTLSGFGKFSVKASLKREGRNPRTGAAMTIPASKRLSFSAAKAAKDALNG
jgi:DNA-binding protein HU-beta